MYRSGLSKKMEQGRIECLACSHYCKIAEGRSGICGVLRNEGGNLYLLVYGKAAAINIDPIEKKPLFHFLPGSRTFSLGTLGCNFACQFCQNWDISQTWKLIKEKYSDRAQQWLRLEEIADYGQDWPPEKIVDYCSKNRIPTISYTYNEPAIFFEYAFDTARLAHENGIKNVFVSNGYESKEALEMIKPYLDGINIDLKSFRNEFYAKRCQAKIQPVLENIRRVYEAGIWIEITTLVIPEENGSEKELSQIAEFISGISPGIPWHVSAFHPDYKMLDRASTPLETLQKGYQIGKQAGLQYVYTGNIFGGKESTYCPVCGEVLILRRPYQIEFVNFKQGDCGKCGQKIGGVWN